MQLPVFLSVSQIASDCAYCWACGVCLGTPTPDFEFFVAALVAGGP